MISETATGCLKRWLGERFRFYRLFFNAVAILTLIPVLWYASALRQEPVWRWEGAWAVVRYTMLGCGILLALAGGRHYSFGQFTGISQIRKGAASGFGTGGLSAGGGIDSSGVLGLVRHPWYTAVVLLIWSGDLDMAALVGNSVLTVYVVIGTLLEERKLVHEFGDAYRSYQKRVSMFVPLKRVWPREGDGA
jgi:protein-S-isoprenylcysteine O-methyltransferase Ste14